MSGTIGGRVARHRKSVLLGFGVLNLDRDPEQLGARDSDSLANKPGFLELDVANAVPSLALASFDKERTATHPFDHLEIRSTMTLASLTAPTLATFSKKLARMRSSTLFES